jgi:hypothetical protein
MFRLKYLSGCALAAVALLLSPEPSHAGPPQELYNKSIILSWATGYNWKDTDGTSGHVVTQFDRHIYISNAGRIFQQSSNQLVGRQGRAVGISSAKSKGPDGDLIKTSNAHGSGSYSWNGRELVGFMKVESGAFHLHVKFDEAFRGCTLSFVSGKEENAPGIVKKSMRGNGQKLVMLSSTGNSGMSCNVKDGNVFGG